MWKLEGLSHCQKELLSIYVMERTGLSAEAGGPPVGVSVGMQSMGFERSQAIYEFFEWGSSWSDVYYNFPKELESLI